MSQSVGLGGRGSPAGRPFGGRYNNRRGSRGSKRISRESLRHCVHELRNAASEPNGRGFDAEISGPGFGAASKSTPGMMMNRVRMRLRILREVCEIRRIDSSDSAVNKIAGSWLCLLRGRNCQSQGNLTWKGCREGK